MAKPFFKRIGLFMMPVGFIGWLILLAAIAYMVWEFMDIDSRSHSASDTLINWAFNGLIVAVIYSIIAGLSFLLVKEK